MKRASGSASLLARLFAVHRDDLYSVGMHGLRTVQLEVDILDDEGPNFVTEAVGIEMALTTARLRPSNVFVEGLSVTLKDIRAFTFSAKTSATIRSKCWSILIAIWGSILRSDMNLSSASVMAAPTLHRVRENSAGWAAGSYLLRRYSS